MLDNATILESYTTNVAPIPVANMRSGRSEAMAQATNPGRNGPEQAAIRHVVARLTRQFPELSADDIDRAVYGQYDRFDGSPVRDFVPVLVERATRRQLSQDHARHNSASGI
jgi:hypothetical protein